MKKEFNEMPQIRIGIFDCEDVVCASGEGPVTESDAVKKAEAELNSDGIGLSNVFKFIY